MKVALIGLEGHPMQIWDGIPQLEDCDQVAIAAPDAAVRDAVRK